MDSASMDQRDTTTTNEQVIDYLKYYVALDAPRYAVLLNGPWGSGKTHLIQCFLEENFSNPPTMSKSITKKIRSFLHKHGVDQYFNEKLQDKSTRNYVYISLYGLKSEDDISARIIASAVPGLGLKTTKILGSIIKSLLQPYRFTKFITELSIRNFISKFHKKIYIFDDIERCEIPVKQLFGYINQYVEHGEKNVIIIVNEYEITEKSEFSKTQEKIIGKTLQIEIPVSEATENSPKN